MSATLCRSLGQFTGRYVGVRFLSSAKPLDVGGVFPPIVTPFNKNEEIDVTKLKFNMEKWNKIPFRGYVIHGSNGECAFLNWDERIQMVQEVKKLAAPQKLIIAGAGCEATRDTILMTQKMAEAGAGAVMVVNPFYYKASMNAAALVAHFTKVADQSPVPVILYSVPGNTGLEIPPEAVVKLAAHPNIIGIKDSGGDISRIASLVFQTSSLNFQVLAGSAGFLLAAHSVGCVGGICALANVLGEEVCRLLQLAQAQDMKAAQSLQLRLVGPNACVTKRFGVPGLKTSMEWFGYYGGPTRSPLLPLSDADKTAMRQVFEKSQFL